MLFVYVLESGKDSKRYYGFTKDIDNRLDYHNRGKVKSTKSRLPMKLVYYEEVDTIEEAIIRERFFKSGQGRDYITTKMASSSNG